MGMGGFGPPPADALVTPVTFQVKRRRLRGILESLDAQETGTRELSGEWLVGKRTWQRLQTEWKAAQVGQRTHNPHKPTERVILYIHGGRIKFLHNTFRSNPLQVPTTLGVQKKRELSPCLWRNTRTRVYSVCSLSFTCHFFLTRYV